MTIPRQLAPTVGLSRDGFEFLKGNFEGLKGYAVGRMTKSHRGKLYIDDAGWAPRPAQSSTGTGSPLEEFTSSSARSANRALSQTSAPTSSRRLSVQALPGFMNGAELEPASDGETVVHSDDESSTRRPSHCTNCKMASLGAIPMATVFRTPLNRRTGLRSSWLELSPRCNLQPRQQ